MKKTGLTLLFFCMSLRAMDSCTLFATCFLSPLCTLYGFNRSGALAESVYRGIYLATQLKKTYLGFGIMYDRISVESTFSETEQQLFKDPSKNAKSIVEAVNQKLHGDYEKEMASEKYVYRSPFLKSMNFDWEKLTDAKDLFEKRADCARGVCRHKAVAMAAFLNDLNISATVFYCVPKSGKGLPHAVVKLPSLGLIADPANGLITDQDLFLEEWKKRPWSILN